MLLVSITELALNWHYVLQSREIHSRCAQELRNGRRGGGGWAKTVVFGHHGKIRWSLPSIGGSNHIVNDSTTPEKLKTMMYQYSHCDLDKGSMGVLLGV